MTYTMTNEQIQAFATHLRMEEHSQGTIKKYTGAIKALHVFLPSGKTITKEQLLAWKNQLCATLAASTVNVFLLYLLF